MRVERRAAGTTGRKSFVSIHTRPTVTRDPLPELYRDVRDAYKILILTVRIRMGKGLRIWRELLRCTSGPSGVREKQGRVGSTTLDGW